MDIRELEKIMTEHPWLPKPRFVYLVKERVEARLEGKEVIFRGVAPKNSKDRIALTPDADEITVVHELLHLAGLGEVGAYVLAPPIRRIRRILRPVFRFRVKYELVEKPSPSVEVYERTI